MSTINVTAAEDIQCGDIVAVDAATLQARRLVDGDEFVGIANEPISVGDALIMDLATGRLTKNGTDVVDVAGATLGAFDYLVATTLAGYVDGLETLLTTANTNLGTLHTDLATTLAGLATSFNGYVDQLEGYVDGLETLVTSTNTKLDSLITGTKDAGSKLSADIEREDARQRPPGILTPVTAPPDALMTTLDDPRRCWGCAFYSFKTYTNQAETQGKCFRDFDATRHYWWVDGLMTCPRFQSGDTSAKLD